MITFLAIVLVLFLGYVYYEVSVERKERHELQSFLLKHLGDIQTAVAQFNRFLDNQSGYFSNYQMVSWKEKYQQLNYLIKGKSIEKAKLEQAHIKAFHSFVNYYTNASSLRDNYNSAFIRNELAEYKEYFDTVTGKPLDLQQRTAIVKDEDANLVIAGAGSGKTTTIVGKVKYLVERHKIEPNNILLISFTKKSAATLASRVNVDGILAKTFHSFGIEVIKQVEGKRPSIFEEEQFRPFIKKTFKELIEHDDYLKSVTDYFTNFLKPVATPFDFESQGDYIQYLKDNNFRTYKAKEFNKNGKTTYKMQVVKSIEECRIANFLLFNGINYEYEYPYEYDTASSGTRQYKPDFTIFHNGERIYLEHQAISRDGNVPPFFAKKNETYEQAKAKYWDKIKWVRNLHEAKGTTLIETYSYEMSDESWVENLTRRLEDEGVVLAPKSPKDIWEIINHTANDEVDGFVTLFQTFITLMKSNNYSISDISKRNILNEESLLVERNARYTNIVKPIFERYEAYLDERQEIDFSDMINKASTYISEGLYDREFDYIIIDEFQDISIGRYKLIKALKDANPACRIFCVGDDWQSIYRFTGSDIALFKEYDKYFGYSIKSKIETTYRFSNPLIKLSSDFILKNTNQTEKSLRPAFPEKPTNYEIVYSDGGSQNDVTAVKDIFDSLIYSDIPVHSKSIFILSRYGFDISRLEDKERTFKIRKNVEVKEEIDGNEFSRITDVVEYSPFVDITLRAEFLTVHKSKGLEADIVIVINCNSGKHGFPSEMSDDKVLNLLLSDADQFENGEERRLFYVAMTRAKEQVYFVADNAFKSKFITEIEVDTDEKTIPKCPDCKTADIVVRKAGIAKNGNKYTFWGCSNFLYGCDYNNMVWENKSADK